MSENNNFKEKAEKVINDVKDDSKSFDKKDIESGKIMAVISYIGILSLISYFAEQKNKYVVYHAKQGLNLFILEIIAGVALSLIDYILGWRLIFLSNLINTVVSVAIFALSILGIINVCNGKAKELPVVNKFKFIK